MTPDARAGGGCLASPECAASLPPAINRARAHLGACHRGASTRPEGGQQPGRGGEGVWAARCLWLDCRRVGIRNTHMMPCEPRALPSP